MICSLRSQLPAVTFCNRLVLLVKHSGGNSSRSSTRCRSTTSASGGSSSSSNDTIRGKNTAGGAYYPYPTHPNPTPHQIFHLPTNASQDAIKSRYYELVKIYHPDSPLSRTSAAAAAAPAPSNSARPTGSHTSEARFQAITAAYNTLRKGKIRINTATAHDNNLRGGGGGVSDWHKQELRNRADSLSVGGWDERWKERLMLGVLFLSVAMLAYQTFDARKQTFAAMLERDKRRRRGQLFDDDHDDDSVRRAVSQSASDIKQRSEATIRDEESLALSDVGNRSS